MAILKFENKYIITFNYGDSDLLRNRIFEKFNIVKTNFNFDPTEQFNMAESDKYKFHFDRDRFGNVTILEISKKE